VKTVPQPEREYERLEALRRYGVLDTTPDPALDELTALAGFICDAPISLITLVDDSRHGIKSRVGISIDETAREISFCAHAITQSELFIVPDAMADDRFADSALVTGDPHVRFYAGAPLVTADGHALGTLCVFDRVPRTLTTAQENALRVLGRQVMAQLDLQRQTKSLAESEERLFHVFRDCPVGVAIQKWPDQTFVDVNASFTQLFGWERHEILGLTSEELGILEAGPAAEVRARIIANQTLRDTELAARTRSGEVRYVLLGTVLTQLRGVPHTITTFVDVTARKLTEVANNRLAAIVQSSGDAIIGKDVEGTITNWNRGAAKIFGYSALEVIGSSIMRLIPEDRRDEEIHILQQIRRGESVDHFETVRRTKDDRRIDVSVTTSPIKDAFGRIIGASKILRDITEQKRAEGLLREREEQLRLYAEHSPAAIAMLDRDMRYLVVSRRWMQDNRLGTESIVGRSHYDVFPDLPERWIVTHKRALAGSVESCEEDAFPRADGSVEWLRWEIRPWHQADGSIGGIIIFTEDVSERKLSSAALKASEERMRFALDNAEIGIWDFDYVTGAVRWSHHLELQYGLAPGTFGGTFEAVMDCVYEPDRAGFAETFRLAEESGKDFSILSRAVWPDGSIHWLNGAGRIHRDEHGRPIRGVGISMDITARRSLEAQYQQAQKMEAVGRLAGGVAHDFNNLLTVILGYCELLLREFDEGDERRADIAEIQSAGTRASGLTRQLLAFSRKQIIEPVLLDVNQVVSTLRTMLGRLIGEDVEIGLDLDANLWPVMADRGQLEQVVMNLVINARDAMPDGGKLTIATKNVTLDENHTKMHPGSHPGDHVALIVSDTGIGMSSEVQSRMFEPFFTTKEPGKGTGLGMATVYGIVTQSHGSIDVESEIGKGTSFTLYLPRSDESAASAAALPLRSAPRDVASAHTILLVEDEEGVRELTRKFLERLGYVVLVAPRAVDALRLSEMHSHIDLVLTDVVMPTASGPELMQRLSKGRPKLKVIYMSGYTEDVILHHGVLGSGVSFLSKPFTFEMLGDKLRQVLEH
jgi:two-component system cell cycle sensor histidine kinase/response regulator CckA